MHRNFGCQHEDCNKMMLTLATRIECVHSVTHDELESNLVALVIVKTSESDWLLLLLSCVCLVEIVFCPLVCDHFVLVFCFRFILCTNIMMLRICEFNFTFSLTVCSMFVNAFVSLILYS